jgi:hypothetical protein
MANFKIISSKRVDLEHCEFTVEPLVDEPQAGEIFVLTESTGPWEYVIQAVEPVRELRKLACMNWIAEDNQFSGVVASSRPMNATERRRYRQWL